MRSRLADFPKRLQRSRGQAPRDLKEEEGAGPPSAGIRIEEYGSRGECFECGELSTHVADLWPSAAECWRSFYCAKHFRQRFPLGLDMSAYWKSELKKIR